MATEAYCTLNFKDNSEFRGSTELVYYSTEMGSRGSGILFDHKGKFVYDLKVGTKSQTLDRFMRSNMFIEIAPLSTKLQLQLNNISILLSILVAYFAFAEFIRRKYFVRIK